MSRRGKNRRPKSDWWQRYESWWLDVSISDHKLTLFRVAFFAIVGIDAFLQISHAPRYGTSDFNVANLPLLADVLPVAQRPGMLLVWMVQAYLGLRIAFGGATRSATWLLCAAFGYGYFISQLDSYQHHYLVFLILLLCCFVRWDKPRLESAWPIRAILMTISVVYVFAAISKLEASWIDGHTLYFQVKKAWLHDWISKLGAVEITGGELVNKGGYAVAAAIVVCTELFLAVAIHVRKLVIPAVVIGIAFHLGVEIAGFKIGLFSYFMCALYILVLPESWLERSEPVVSRIRDALGAARRRLTGDWSITWTAAAICLAGSAALMWSLPFPDMLVPVIVVLAVGVVGVFERRGRSGKHRTVLAVAAAHLAAALAIFALTQLSATARDYHRYWAASLRESGELEKAVPIYERAVQIDPDYAPGHTSLANLYRRTGRNDKAIEHYTEAQRLEPDNWRPYAGEAMAQDALGNGDAALEAATRALEINPNHRESAAIVAKYRK